MHVKESPTIAIITALPKEHAAVVILLQNTRDVSIPSQRGIRRYKIGEVSLPQGGKHVVVLALLPNMGTNMAGIWASHILDDFSSIQDIIMVGIAGGIPYPEKPGEHVRLGDIVVSDQYGVIQYDFVKETIHERKSRALPRPPSPSLLHSVKLLESGEMQGKRPWLPFITQAASLLDSFRPPAETDVLVSSIDPEKIIAHPEDKKRTANHPRIFTGPIAASNTLLKNPIFRDELRNQFGVKAVEMESSGIADATWDGRAGYLVIRGICDYCDANKGDAWQEYAAIVAAAYTRALLETIPYNGRLNAAENSSSNGIPSRPTDTAAIEAAQQKLVNLPLDKIPEVAPLPQGSRMPFNHNPHFVGREADLQTLATALKGRESVVIGQVATAAVAGMGGIGKTQFASEFVHRYGQYFAGGVFWLSFANAETVQSEIADCNNMVDLEMQPSFPTLPLSEKVRLVLFAWQSPLPRLLVFDNCEDEQLFNQWRPHTGGCRILITSLRPNWPSDLGIKVLPLGCLSREESLLLLCKYRDDLSVDNPDLYSIADELGDLPLALHLAGRFLDRYRLASFGVPGVYLTKLRQVTPLQHSSLRSEGVTSTTNHIQHVEQTFALAYEQLEIGDREDQQALRLLARASYFARGVPIPRDILRSTLMEMSDNSDMELLAEDALERLISLGLLESLENGLLRLHRLIAEFVKIRIGIDTEAQTAVEQVVLLAAAYISVVGYPQYILALQPHLQAVTNLAKQRNDLITAQLCNAWGNFLLKAGAYDEAQAYLERALDVFNQNPGRDQAGFVTLLNNLAQVHEVQSDIRQAKHFVQSALEVGEQVLGSEHLLITDCLNTLAKLYFNDGEIVEAEKTVRKSLKIRKRLLEPDHPDIAIVLNHLAQILQAQGQGKYPKAESCFQQALAIWKKNFGKNHPDVAECLNNLAGLYRIQHKYTQAEQFYKDALKIREQELGINHFDVAFSLNGLAVCYTNQGKHVEAEPLYDRALKLLEQKLGIGHRFVVQTLMNLVDNYFAQGKYDLAEPLLLRVSASRDRKCGPEHFKVAQSLEYLAQICYLQEKYVKAVMFLERALMLYEQVGGPEHPGVIKATSILRKIKQKAEEEL